MGKEMYLNVDDSAGRGRPRKAWLEYVSDDMRKLGLKKEMAQDRTVWRSAIHRNCASMENMTLNG